MLMGEVRREQMGAFLSILSADRGALSPRLRASASSSIPPLDAIPTRTEPSASRYVRAIADGGCAAPPEIGQRQSPCQTPGFSSLRGFLTFASKIIAFPHAFFGRESEETFNSHTNISESFLPILNKIQTLNPESPKSSL